MRIFIANMDHESGGIVENWLFSYYYLELARPLFREKLKKQWNTLIRRKRNGKNKAA